MSDELKTKKECGKQSVFRYYWPGKDASWCCAEHLNGISAVANAIGLHVAMEPDMTETCKSFVKNEEKP